MINGPGSTKQMLCESDFILHFISKSSAVKNTPMGIALSPAKHVEKGEKSSSAAADSEPAEAHSAHTERGEEARARRDVKNR